MTTTDLKVVRRCRWAAIASSLLAVTGIASPASAQTAAPATALDSTADGKPPTSAIVVTGSRIARPDLNSTVPISIVSGDTFIKQGQTNIGDTLNDYPQLRSSRGQQNSSTGVGISGLNLLDLRGLGTVRTLVLVNGRRHVGADILNNAVSVDTNTIPANLVQRVDIVTGGESAIYGSDAIAGVVNFILRKDFDGIEANAKFGISTPGGYGANHHLDAVYGRNFADGRGNITLSAEYNHQNRVYASDVPWLARVDGLGVTDLDPAGLANNSDGVFDRTYLTDIRQTNLHVNGLVPITQGSAGALCGIGTSNGAVPGTPYNCTYIFNADGTLVPQTGARVGPGVLGSALGGNGQTGREGDLYTVLPRQDIYNFNLLGHYAFSEAADLFWEAKYARIVSLGGNAGTASIQGDFRQFDLRERVRLDNPFLSPAARTLIAGSLLASGCNPSISFACNVAGTASTAVRIPLGAQGIAGPLNAADIAQIAAGTYRFVVARNLDDLGERQERFLRQTWRAVIGMRGTFNSDWKYELAFNYGRFTEHTDASGYVDKQRFLLSLDAGLNPATGKIECRAKFDPASAIAFPASAANLAKLAGDIAACVPFNPFGKPDNSAAVNYFGTAYQNDSWMTQKDLSGYLAGNTRGFLTLPGGPIDFVIGGEYREEDVQYVQDAFSAAGNTNAVAFGTFAPEPLKVSEGFAELHLPILKDRPLFERLTLSGAARISHYSGGVGSVWAFNGGGEWEPVGGLRLRANYSRAVRAPNLVEAGQPAIANFAPGFIDPCSPSRIASGTQFRAGNCTADLGALIGNLAGLGSYSLPIISGSNPNLKPETSNSLTIGAVIQPHGLRGLTVSIDYYNIEVNDVIVSLTAQTIANSCYDQPALTNPFCASFQRVRSGTGPLGELAGQIQGNTLVSAPFNFARRLRRGIDVQLDYNLGLGNDTRLSTHLIYSHGLKNSNYENPTLPDFENRILGELGDPQDEFRWSADLKRGAFTFGYEMHYIGPMWVNNYEDFNALQDRTPQDADYSEIARFPSVYYHDIRFEWDMDKSGIARNFLFYAGIDNLFNRTPPLGSSGSGGTGGINDRPGSQNSNAAIYAVRGRQVYAGVRAKF